MIAHKHKVELRCPVCQSSFAGIEELIIDETFSEILSYTSPKTVTVVIKLDKDNIAWKDIPPVKKHHSNTHERSLKNVKNEQEQAVHADCHKVRYEDKDWKFEKKELDDEIHFKKAREEEIKNVKATKETEYTPSPPSSNRDISPFIALQAEHDCWRRKHQQSGILIAEKRMIDLSTQDITLCLNIPDHLFYTMQCTARGIAWKRKLEEIRIYRYENKQRK